MSMLEIILLFYVLPVIIVGTFNYFDKLVQTLGDWFKGSLFVFVPVINTISAFLVILLWLQELSEIVVVKSGIIGSWKELMNIRIKKQK